MTASAWRLPGYVVGDRLGVGGSGQVWRARTRGGGEAVAIKLLPAVGRDHLTAVRSEAAMLSGLEHPHLLRLREVVPSKQGLALVVDLASGGSLAALLAARGRLTAGEVVTVIAPIGAALAYAHNAGVVHGDVSAANLLFTDAGFPLLADLGVARLIGDDAPVSSTPAYIDPAVALGAVPAPASDVFMLGAVALHALTGDPAWPGESAEQTLAAAAAVQLGDVGARMRRAGVPEAVAEVVARALRIEPEARPTAAEFALDLRYAAEPVAVELAAGREPATPEQPGAADALFTHLVRPRHRAPVPVGLRGRLALAIGSRRRAAGAVLAAGLVAVLAAVALVWWPGGTAASPAESRPAAPPDPRALTTTAAADVLLTLDATRARAFAERDPRLLSAVYSAAQLRADDGAMITRIVRAGCALVGVRTDYDDVVVIARTPRTVALRVRASLRRSTLECAGVRSATAPPAPATTLRIVLVHREQGYLIDSITP